MSGKAMKEYHFHTIQSFLADIPAYLVICWMKFANILNTPQLPNWEQWLFDHGWLVLLTLRIIATVWDLKLKVEIENGSEIKEVQPEKKKLQSISDFLKFIYKLLIR